LPIHLVNITPKYNMDMYTELFRRVNTTHIVYPNKPEIKEQLTFLQKQYAGWGWRVQATRGHLDDIPDAIANLCLLLIQNLGKKAEWGEMVKFITAESLRTMFKSSKFDYATPQEIFDKLNEEFHFTLDPCASPENAKCKQYFTIKEDGLKQDWFGNVFMNPPYGRQIKNWIAKAYYECKVERHCNIVVCLIPARTDTQWWHEFCMDADEIRFIKGRIKFDGKNSAPFPSCLVIFRNETTKFVTINEEIQCPKCGYTWTEGIEIEPPEWYGEPD